jgi:serine/threonine protein kinase
MAPEQRDPDGRVGPPADVWGLAATLHTALTGEPRRPEAGGGAGASRFGRRRRAPAVPRRTPPALADAIAAGLDPDPASRPTARELAEALEPLVAALPRVTLGRV